MEGAGKSTAGTIFFEQLKTRFWERPCKYNEFLIENYIYSNINCFLGDQFDEMRALTAAAQNRRRVSRGKNLFV